MKQSLQKLNRRLDDELPAGERVVIRGRIVSRREVLDGRRLSAAGHRSSQRAGADLSGRRIVDLDHDTVCVVHADLPAIDRALDLPFPEVGLGDYLEGQVGATVTVRRPAAGGFWVLSAGAGVLRRPEVLTSPRMVALLKAADRAFDYTIVDCPPLLPVADAVVFQDHIDGFLFVVRARHSPRETVQRAADLLKPERICGVVMNGHHDILPSYREYAYRRYGTEPRG